MTHASPRVLGLIPARGGSKRLPGKNLKPLCGKPLIAWTIDAALAARSLTQVVVSTDDPAIAGAARDHGAEVPFLRPAELASDTADGLSVTRHAVQVLADAGTNFDYVMVLQPTSPLRSAADIDAAIALAVERDADNIVSVCPTDHPPEWSNALPADNNLKDFYRPGVRGIRSQDLPVSYRLNGALYLHRTAPLLAGQAPDTRVASYAYIMPRERSVDIDTAMDFAIASLFAEAAQRGDGHD